MLALLEVIGMIVLGWTLAAVAVVVALNIVKAVINY